MTPQSVPTRPKTKLMSPFSAHALHSIHILASLLLPVFPNLAKGTCIHLTPQLVSLIFSPPYHTPTGQTQRGPSVFLSITPTTSLAQAHTISGKLVLTGLHLSNLSFHTVYIIARAVLLKDKCHIVTSLLKSLVNLHRPLEESSGTQGGKHTLTHGPS